MKKIIASAGLVAMGTAGLHAADTYGLTRMEAAKPWSIAASLRGFYDDNYNTAPSSSAFKRDSFGFEFSPSFMLNFPMETTYVGLGYIYSLKYYDDRPNNNVDHSHELTLKTEHRMSERYKINFNDSFAYAQEPEVVESGGPIGAPIRLRSKADVLRNRAAISFTAQVTERLGAEAGYQNTWYDYQEEAKDVMKEFDPIVGPNNGGGSRSALLDRFEHLIHLDGRWQVQERLIGVAGYQFGVFDYTSKEPLLFLSPPPSGRQSVGNDRDSTSHYLYLGADREFSAQLNGQVRVGVQYTDYDHFNASQWNPYADLNATYTYLPGSYLKVGFKHTRNATDVPGSAASGQPTLDAESSTLYGSVNHRITPQVTGSVLGQFQRSSFNGGGPAIDDKVDNFFLVGLNLEYRINQNWATEAGYNYDRLDSDLNSRSFTRNRVYLGVRASY